MTIARELPEPYFCDVCHARLWETLPDARRPDIRGAVNCRNGCETEIDGVDAAGRPVDMNTVLG